MTLFAEETVFFMMYKSKNFNSGSLCMCCDICATNVIVAFVVTIYIYLIHSFFKEEKEKYSHFFQLGHFLGCYTSWCPRWITCRTSGQSNSNPNATVADTILSGTEVHLNDARMAPS